MNSFRTGFSLRQIEYPYFGTEFAKPLQHAGQIIKDAVALKVLRADKRLSPPFYGNMMRVFATAK